MLDFLKRKKAGADHLKTGAKGENAAVKYLKKNKYKIIERNARVGRSEIDIVAVKDETLVFIEVKTRTVRDDGGSSFSRPADAVNKSKAAYLIRGANGYIRENSRKFAEYYKRFDIIEVYLTKKGSKTVFKELKHFENAVR